MNPILYTIDGCSFCGKVIEFAKQCDVALDTRSISNSEVYFKELMEKGGKKQAPFLVDVQNEVSIYESDDIIKYLKKMCA